MKIPTLSASIDTVIFIFYGNASISSSQQNPSGVWEANYTGVWHFSEPSWAGVSGEVIDSAGANHGTAAFAANSTSGGKFFRGALFGANDDHVDAGSDASLMPASITVEAWANPQSVGTSPERHPYMVTQDTWRLDGSDPRGYYMEIYRTLTNPSPTFYVANGAVSSHAVASTDVSNGSWYHVVGTHDATTGDTKLYVNGVLEDVESMTGGVVYDPAKPVRIGGRTNETWNGILDEVRISNVPRSADWIMTEYNNQSSPSTFYAVGAEEMAP